MGEDYVDYYKRKSDKWKVVPFMYCTEWIDRNSNEENIGPLKVLYVGSLSKRKNVKLLLNACYGVDNIELGLIGDGEERGEIERMSEISNGQILMYGNMKMSDIPDVMQRYDVLVLPSLHDGWGAVVNEALILGLYVVCSNKCGAKMLVANNNNGTVFESDNCEDLRDKLKTCVFRMDEIRNTVHQRINWSKENISGKAVAQRFLDGINKMS